MGTIQLLLIINEEYDVSHFLRVLIPTVIYFVTPSFFLRHCVSCQQSHNNKALTDVSPPETKKGLDTVDQCRPEPGCHFVEEQGP